MKLHYLPICAALVIPAFAQQDPARNQDRKHFGLGACLPKFLEQYDIDGDGVINEEERQAMVEARKQIREHLRQGWDEDGDGKLCEQERQHARKQLRTMMEEKRTERFNEADADGDGFISKDEFLALPGIADKIEALKENLANLPEDVSAFMKNNIEKHLANLENRMNQIFDKIDTDVDGLISLDEFLAIGQGGQGGQGGGMGKPGKPGQGGGMGKPGQGSR